MRDWGLNGGGNGKKTDFKKYCRPARLFSRNRGRNLEMMLLGGSSGTAASKPGKVRIRRHRNSSNSEYRLRMFMWLPWIEMVMLLAVILAWAREMRTGKQKTEGKEKKGKARRGNNSRSGSRPGC